MVIFILIISAIFGTFYAIPSSAAQNFNDFIALAENEQAILVYRRGSSLLEAVSLHNPHLIVSIDLGEAFEDMIFALNIVGDTLYIFDTSEIGRGGSLGLSRVYRFDSETQKAVLFFERMGLGRFYFSPEHDYVLVGGYEAANAFNRLNYCILEVATGDCRKLPQTRTNYTDVKWLDNTHYISLEHDYLSITDITTLETQELPGLDEWSLGKMDIIPGSRTLLFSGNKRDDRDFINDFILYNLDTATITPVFTAPNDNYIGVGFIAISPDGQYALYHGRNRFWSINHLQDGALIGEFSYGSMQWLPHSNLLVGIERINDHLLQVFKLDPFTNTKTVLMESEQSISIVGKY